VSPLITTGIHVTNNNDIILGVMEEDTFKLTDTSCRKIIVIGENKKEKQSYQYNKRQQRLFTIPFRIKDVNSDIVVIDRASDDDGRVVVLGKEGDVKWFYQGHPQINTEDKSFEGVISGDTERNGLTCPDCVISLTSELLYVEIRISLLFVSVMS
jgi:hypothetical protein